MNREKFKKMLIVAITTTLMGQVYVNPFDTPFRLSLGIAILTFLLLQFDDIPILPATLLTSLSVFVFRVSIDLFQSNKIISLGVNGIVAKHLPSAIFYLVFGLALFQLHIRDYREHPIHLIFLVGISDILANIAEAASRLEFTMNSIDVILTSLFVAGFGRATLAFLFYTSLKAYNLLILREEHEMKYRNLLIFTANMKAEIFFLSKTMQDIEKAMERCYSIYSELKTKERVDIDYDYMEKLKNRILNLSKDIHEIKKDNQRVVFGIERLLPQGEQDNIMKLSSIFKILRDNLDRYIQRINKEINLFTHTSFDFVIKDYYPLITIINNLISNSIDSIEKEGFVRLSQGINNEFIIFEIRDNGTGIKEEDIDVIFEPGFSTKFDKSTGNMSTGIGLTHVKHIVENHYGGHITVESNPSTGTKFSINIPREKIILREGE